MCDNLVLTICIPSIGCTNLFIGSYKIGNVAHYCYMLPCPHDLMRIDTTPQLMYMYTLYNKTPHHVSKNIMLQSNKSKGQSKSRTPLIHKCKWK